MSFLSALDAEIADLEKAVEADPKVIKLRELMRVRALYADDRAAGVNGRAVELSSTNRQTPFQEDGQLSLTTGSFAMAAHVYGRRAAGRKQSPERQRALAVARDYLVDRLEPVKTSEIYQHLLVKGIALGGNDPVNNLSAMLSNAPGFRSHGRSGWTTLSLEEAME